MNSFIRLTLAVVVAVIFLEYQHGALAAVEEKPCNVVIQDLTKKQLGGIAGCTKEMKFKNGKEKAKKMTCVMKCVLKKEALLDGAGQLTNEQFALFLERHFPPSMHAKVNTTFGPCLESAGKGMDDSEEFCKDYDPMVKCLLGVFPGMCK